MSTKNKKLLFGILYFGFFILTGFFTIKFFFFDADYSRNTTPRVPISNFGSPGGRTIDSSPLIQGLTFLIFFTSALFMALTNRKKLNNATKTGIYIALIILLLATIFSFLRYSTQVSLFDFIDPNQYR